jgi:hypothetical protein
LWVELPRERLDLPFVDPVRAAKKPLPDVQASEVEGPFLAVLIRVRPAKQAAGRAAYCSARASTATATRAAPAARRARAEQ